MYAEFSRFILVGKAGLNGLFDLGLTAILAIVSRIGNLPDKFLMMVAEWSL
jgi:hypothetical protein